MEHKLLEAHVDSLSRPDDMSVMVARSVVQIHDDLGHVIKDPTIKMNN